jgi:hypothetical protein
VGPRGGGDAGDGTADKGAMSTSSSGSTDVGIVRAGRSEGTGKELSGEESAQAVWQVETAGVASQETAKTV